MRTRRPTTRAREDAKDELDALRRMVFRAEESAEPSASRIYATARQPIDMARRALDLRLVYQEGSASQDIRQPADAFVTPRDDRCMLSAMRRRLLDRHAVLTSWEAIRQSRDLLARFGAPSLR